MPKLTTILTAFIGGLAISDAAFAQDATPITHGEVVGDWRLLITPAEGQGRSVTFKARDGSQRLDFPLAITPQSNGRLNCIIDGDPGECRIRNGEFRIASPSDGFTIIYTLENRTREGFAGVADLRVRRLPIGGPIGSVRMVRR
ncbi:hypothetical protein [Brevundimonas lutea]|uniref:hypothetical protein n=1 Tax=Brevundimonas lutea TaxID=2293980 RepID=UPI000F0353F2|nr:hypothetical protein [Brevundimonas lutea]